jgi:glycosyltransferase involved in cell wall biosynthesis
MKDIYSKVDLFISPSQFLRRKFIEFGIPEDRITLFPYGFNLENFGNLQKVFSDKLRFGFIGNLLPAKGTHILIEAFNKIKNYNVELRVYGQVNSYKGILGNYLKYLKKISKNKNIKFMGRFDYKDVGEIFKEIDVLVVPSIWYENSPLVIQEAFATKTPVIASDIGGIPELIDDGVNGLLFDPNDSDDLYKKINLIIENPSLIEEIRQNIKPPKSIEENAKEIEKIYNKLTQA